MTEFEIWDDIIGRMRNLGLDGLEEHEFEIVARSDFALYAGYCQLNHLNGGYHPVRDLKESVNTVLSSEAYTLQHLVRELLQNAWDSMEEGQDALEWRLEYNQVDGTLLFRHDGKPFDGKPVHPDKSGEGVALVTASKTTKRTRFSTTGQFGLGFKGFVNFYGNVVVSCCDASIEKATRLEWDVTHPNEIFEQNFSIDACSSTDPHYTSFAFSQSNRIQQLQLVNEGAPPEEFMPTLDENVLKSQLVSQALANPQDLSVHLVYNGANSVLSISTDEGQENDHENLFRRLVSLGVADEFEYHLVFEAPSLITDQNEALSEAADWFVERIRSTLPPQAQASVPDGQNWLESQSSRLMVSTNAENVGRWMSNHAFIDQNFDGHDVFFNSNVIWRVDAPFFLESTRVRLDAGKEKANQALMRRTLRHALPSMAQAMRTSPDLIRLYNIPQGAFFTSTFTHMADEPNQSTRYTLVEAFGNGEDLFFDATGGGIPTETVRKIPQNWLVTDEQGNRVWIADAVRNLVEDQDTLRNALPFSPFARSDDGLPKAVPSERTFLHFAPEIRPRELFDTLSDSGTIELLVDQYPGVLQESWFVPVHSEASLVVLHAPQDLGDDPAMMAFNTLWQEVGEALTELCKAVVVTDQNSLIWRKWGGYANLSRREGRAFFGIDFHLVPPERGWGDVVTRLLDVISRSGAENEPAFLDHLGVWIEHIIEASRYDDLESPTLQYRPVELTVHAIEETTGPFHALFPVERVPTRQLFVCREKRTVWQHHTTVTKQLHDPWLPGGYRIIAQRELEATLSFMPQVAQVLAEDAQEIPENPELVEGVEIQAQRINHHVFLALGPGFDHPRRIEAWRRLVASFNAEMNGEVEPNAQPPASQLLLVEASSPPHVGIEHLRWLVREPSFKQTHVRSITTAVEREEMGIPANPQVGTRNSLTSRLNLQSAESTAFLDPGRDIISDDLYQIILTFCRWTAHLCQDADEDEAILLVLDALSANPATIFGKTLTPARDGNWHWRRTYVEQPHDSSLNHGPCIDLIRDAEQLGDRLGAIIAPEDLQVGADENLVFLESTELCGPRYDRRYSTQALRVFARCICYFFRSTSLWDNPDMGLLASAMELTLAEIRQGIADEQLNDTFTALFDPMPPQALGLYLIEIQQNARSLREAIDDDHAACPLVEAVLNINTTDDDTLIQRVCDSAEPWQTYRENGRPLGRVFRWENGLGVQVEYPDFNHQRPLVSETQALWLFPQLEEHGGLAWGMPEGHEICIIRNDLHEALSNDPNGAANIFDTINENDFWMNDCDRIVIGPNQADANGDPWIFARILLRLVDVEYHGLAEEEHQLPLIQEVEGTHESSVLGFEHGPMLTVGRHGWGLAEREDGAFGNAYALVTAQSLPTRQSLAALRQFLPRIIPDLTPHMLESLTLEPDSLEPISTSADLIETLVEAHEAQIGLFNPFTAQGEIDWIEHFLDPAQSLQMEIENLVQDPDSLGTRFDTLQYAVRALRTQHPYLPAQEDVSRPFQHAQALYNGRQSMLLDEPRVLYSENDHGRTHVGRLFRYAQSDNPLHPTYGTHLQESMGNTLFFSPATANRFSMTADPAGLRWADGVIFARAGSADDQQGTLFGNMLRDVQGGHCPGDLYILRDVLRIGEQPYSLVIHPVHLLHIAAQAAARDAANIEEEPAEGPDE